MFTTTPMRICFVSLILGWFLGVHQLYAQNQLHQSTTLMPRQQSIVVMSALTTKGDLQKLPAALNAGLERWPSPPIPQPGA
ncbi:hypothetical protein GCM10023187_35210 [Nibrella viscosa]|uniref:Uncharacterized protein n=2 Tax=Nibrella viscosa TaxID=1084524 RepID=A0ABP8KMW5_9BACT